jgi:restriction system protein
LYILKAIADSTLRKRSMTIPTFDQFIEPILRFLVAHPTGALVREIQEAAAIALGLTDSQRQELLPSGKQAVYKNRAGWAYQYLKQAGLAASPRRGFWQLTDTGLDFVAQHPNPLTAQELTQIVSTVRGSGDRPPAEDCEISSGPGDHGLPASTESPDDRLEAAIAEIRYSVADELLTSLSQVSPEFFEVIVLDLLHQMGYGAKRSDLERVGGSGDGGIDGVISLDKLGLEKVYVQAKRWKQQNSVGRPEIQGFYGALAAKRANRGVFITTSLYTKQAIEFAQTVERIVLIDGKRLAQLMIDHEVGVSARIARIPKLDSDYFDQE